MLIKCNLAEILTKKGIKIKDVAKSTGISRTTLTALSYNQGKGVQFETFDKICSFLDVTPGELFSYFDFRLVVADIHPTKEKYSFYLNCDFVMGGSAVNGTILCQWTEDTNVFRVVIWNKLLYKLEVIPNIQLVQLVLDFCTNNIIKKDISSASKELALYDTDLDEFMHNDIKKDPQ